MSVLSRIQRRFRHQGVFRRRCSGEQEPANRAVASLSHIPGWLNETDQLILEWILSWQTRNEPPGDLVEVGVYQGKSAIHIGRFKQPGETFTVCDLFDDARNEKTIRSDARRTYANLTRTTFERNYLAFHGELPRVIQGLSEVIVDHVPPGSCRLMHIDASHMYEHVRTDTMSARRLLRPSGVVVFDDYRTEHTIGTAAAVWEAVIRDDLRPICVSSMKFYGTWGDPAPLQGEILRRIAERKDHYADHYTVFGKPLIRVAVVPQKKPAPSPK